MKRLIIILVILALVGSIIYYWLVHREADQDRPTYPGPPEYVSPTSPPPGYIP